MALGAFLELGTYPKAKAPKAKAQSLEPKAPKAESLKPKARDLEPKAPKA
jgi:hypothetical protein